MKSKTRGFATVALFTTLFGLSTPGYSTPLPVRDIPPAINELVALDGRAIMLKHALREAEQRLSTGCDFIGTRDRLLLVRNNALSAVNHLGHLWRSGRLRHGALAASEALTRDLVGLIQEAQGAATIAQELGWLQQEIQHASGSHPSAARFVDLPSSALCLSQAPIQPISGVPSSPSVSARPTNRGPGGGDLR